VAAVCATERVGLTLVPITGASDDVDRVAEAAVDGFVVWTTADDDPVVDAVAATGLPAVVHGGPGRRELPMVAIDDRAAARAIGTEAFAGARRPAVLSFPLDRARRGAAILGPDPAAATFPVTRRRLEGFRDACVAAGGTWARVPVIVCSHNSAAEGDAAATELLRRADAPDAIAAMSDELALGALRAAARDGVPVPGELAMTGWDDTEAAAPAGLTTVAQSLHDQGARCAQLALGEAPTGVHEASWRIVRRASTAGSPPAAG
jgi:DNA-binding LacI/PurR family transcriptional regulator